MSLHINAQDIIFINCKEAVMAVIIRYLDLQLHIHSVPITTDVVS